MEETLGLMAALEHDCKRPNSNLPPKCCCAHWINWCGLLNDVGEYMEWVSCVCCCRVSFKWLTGISWSGRLEYLICAEKYEWEFSLCEGSLGVIYQLASCLWFWRAIIFGCSCISKFSLPYECFIDQGILNWCLGPRSELCGASFECFETTLSREIVTYQRWLQRCSLRHHESVSWVHRVLMLQSFPDYRLWIRMSLWPFKWNASFASLQTHSSLLLLQYSVLWTENTYLRIFVGSQVDGDN